VVVEAPEMKGVILAGGMGTRLMPLTKVTNKHLLPVYDKPMIYYPIQTCIDAGVTEILIIVGGESTGDFMKLLGSGEDFGIRITYKCQRGSGGIPVALALAKEFVGKDKFLVVLGDNVMDSPLKKAAEEFASGREGARIFVKAVHDPSRYGVMEINGGKIASIVEKPASPKSSLAITGVYMFDHAVFDIIPGLKPSSRGELEIVDVLNSYLKRNSLSYSEIPGFWTDAGTLEALYEATTLVRQKKLAK
jgi:glucose-1-phosphate thymidylyltransferase